MAKDKAEGREGTFGTRLAELRKAAGYTQTELAVEIGVSQRMVACYEGPHSNPPCINAGDDGEGLAHQHR